jgi:hypothetical protein
MLEKARGPVTMDTAVFDGDWTTEIRVDATPLEATVDCAKFCPNAVAVKVEA